MKAKLTRPDLIFINNNSMISHDDDYSRKIIGNCINAIPELIQIAEMFFDANLHNPESFNFQLVSKVLNDIHLTDESMDNSSVIKK